jgi:hypothetical protein
MSQNWNQRQRANYRRRLDHIQKLVARGNVQGAKNVMECARRGFEMEIITRDPRIREEYQAACTAVAKLKTGTTAKLAKEPEREREQSKVDYLNWF